MLASWGDSGPELKPVTTLPERMTVNEAVHPPQPVESGKVPTLDTNF